MIGKLSLFVAVLVAFQTAVWGKEMFGRCILPTSIQHFDIKKFLGVWYEQATLDDVEANHLWCKAYNFKELKKDGNARIVTVDEYWEYEGVAHKRTMDMVAPNPYTLLNTFLLRHLRGGPQPALNVALDISAIDFQSYAVLHYCYNLMGFQRNENVWVLTRKRIMSSHVRNIVDGIMSEYVMNPGLLEDIQQSYCTKISTNATNVTRESTKTEEVEMAEMAELQKLQKHEQEDVAKENAKTRKAAKEKFAEFAKEGEYTDDIDDAEDEEDTDVAEDKQDAEVTKVWRTTTKATTKATIKSKRKSRRTTVDDGDDGAGGIKNMISLQ